MYFKISSMNTTGTLKYSTARHSAQLSGVIAKSVCQVLRVSHTQPKQNEERKARRTVKNGIYNIAKCRHMLNAMAATRNGLRHIGSTSRLSFSESEFIALNISTVTRIESDIVVARCAIAFVNMSQPMEGKRAEQEWKCVCEGSESQRMMKMRK